MTQATPGVTASININSIYKKIKFMNLFIFGTEYYHWLPINTINTLYHQCTLYLCYNKIVERSPLHVPVRVPTLYISIDLRNLKIVFS